MSLSLEQLRAFAAAVEAGSFSGAARKLGKAQSSVSGLIISMENSMGIPLFDRSKRSPRLTEAGMALINDVNAVLASHQNLRQTVSSVSKPIA
ncbi:LysR family transcriptional regulator [Bowmanella dokdonensis]|uniref:LysR family transcriptional regulator n=1 Tax=Bowmanella dokdonensis TaxID=751969 RepID=A0A939DMF4_9ALTE|nr:LysR family transcriptional regulator [Bowmanella dokdonensis]MBN7825290.1 LysR family transcriptional regulator [Bowmanella dokdonensis]